MPEQEYPDRIPQPADSQGAQERRPPLSRRSMLRRTAGFGAAGLAVAAAGGATTAAVLASRSNNNNQALSQAGSSTLPAASSNGPSPIVIYMADPSSGEMYIFSGTGQTRHTNHSIAATVASMAP